MRAVLRASMAWRLLPVALAAEIFEIFSRGTPWLGEWNWTTDWINGATILTMPLAAACAAYDASTTLRSETWALVVSTPRGVRGFIWPTWSTFLVFTAAHLAGLLLGVAMNVYVGAGSTPSFISVPVALSAIAAAAAVGQGLGLVLPSVVAPPVAGVVLAAVNMIGAGNVIPQFLRIGAATGTLVGLTWDLRVLAVVMAIHLALVAGLTWGLARAIWPKVDGRSRQLVVSASAGVAITSLLVLQSTPWQRLEPSTRPIEFTCLGDDPQVCMAEATSRKLPSLVRAIATPLSVLEAASADVPRAFRQVVPGQPAIERGTAPLFIDADVNATTTSVEEATAFVTKPAMCPQLTAETPPPDDYFNARYLLYSWLLVSQDAFNPRDAFEPGASEWLRLSAAEQAPWVRETYAQLTACEFDDLRMPYPP